VTFTFTFTYLSTIYATSTNC
jgi:hypothetical protein